MHIHLNLRLLCQSCWRMRLRTQADDPWWLDVRHVAGLDAFARPQRVRRCDRAERSSRLSAVGCRLRHRGARSRRIFRRRSRSDGGGTGNDMALVSRDAPAGEGLRRITSLPTAYGFASPPTPDPCGRIGTVSCGKTALIRCGASLNQAFARRSATHARHSFGNSGTSISSMRSRSKK